jgi:hypothetical protein
MRGRIVRYGALVIVLSLPIGGCLEELGTKFNPGPSIDPTAGCARGHYSYGETVGYSCPPRVQVRP